MRRSRLATLFALLASGCLHAPSGPDPVATRQAIDRAAAQVRSCYRSPRVPFAARQIVTRLLVRFSAEGEPLGLPVVLRQDSLTTDNRPYAGRMAEAAVEAVLRCAPIRLPAELHAGGWDEFELTFSPTGIA